MNLAPKMAVNYVAHPDSPGGATKVKKAVVVDVIGGDNAMLDIGSKHDGNTLANATYSNTGEPGTFHLPDEAGAIEKNAADKAAHEKSEAKTAASSK